MKKRIFSGQSTGTSASYPTAPMQDLYRAVLACKSVDECAKFFRDLLTIAEITEFANRWQVVTLLLQHESYAAIAQKLTVSTATVTRVAHWLKHGMGGYQLVADRLFSAKSATTSKQTHSGKRKFY